MFLLGNKLTMGGWSLEIAKMGIYMTLPVGLFYYFNQPKYFEKWVIETRRKLYPPENEKLKKDLEECKAYFKKKQEAKFLRSLQEHEEKNVLK